MGVSAIMAECGQYESCRGAGSLWSREEKRSVVVKESSKPYKGMG